MVIPEVIAKGRKLAGILAAPAWRRAMLNHRVAAGVEHAGMLRQLGELKTVVDIGANRGQFALAARERLPAAAILSFEPLPEAAAVYRAVFAGDGRVSLFETAIGPERGEALIHVSARDDSSSLLPITPAQNATFPGTAEVGTRRIAIGRLADHVCAEAIASPALLKLDVQGFELKALVGCEDCLDRFGWVYVECSFVELYAGQSFADSVIAWLRERGFQLFGIYNATYARDGRAIQADFLFRANSSPGHRPRTPRSNRIAEASSAVLTMQR